MLASGRVGRPATGWNVRSIVGPPEAGIRAARIPPVAWMMGVRGHSRHFFQSPTRSRRKIHPVHQPEPKALRPSPGHHDRIVAAQPHWWRDQREPCGLRRLRQSGANRRVRRHATGDDQQPHVVNPLPHERHRVRRAIRQHLRNGSLETRRDVGRDAERQGAIAAARHFDGDRGLQSREAEITPGPSQHRPRERITPRVALRRQALKRGPARPAEAEQFRDLVERLASRIVDGAAEPFVPPYPMHRNALAMSARNQQQQIGKRRAALHQPWQSCGQRVSFQMVHRDVRQPMRQSDPLRQLAANDQPADETRPGTGRHPAEVAESQARPFHHAPHEARQQRQVRAGSDLGHDAAIWRMLVFLAGNAVREHATFFVHHRRGALITRRLDAQHGSHP